MVGLPGLAAAAAWQQASRPALVVGLAAAAVLAALAPVMLLLAVTTPAAVPQLLVPRSLRVRWRHSGPPRWLPRKMRKPFVRVQPPARLRKAVLRADRGRCLWCKSRSRLELDHLVAFAAGGLGTVFNFFVLCKRCNDIKSNYNVDDDGRVHYRPWGGLDDARLAGRILARERRARWNPLRWWRAALAW